MNLRLLFATGLCVYAVGATAAEGPRLSADANSAADMKAQQQVWLEERRRFDAIDADGDGYISEQEANEQRRLLKSWGKADLNSDGKIDQTEFSAFETEEGTHSR